MKRKIFLAGSVLVLLVSILGIPQKSAAGQNPTPTNTPTVIPGMQYEKELFWMPIDDEEGDLADNEIILTAVYGWEILQMTDQSEVCGRNPDNSPGVIAGIVYNWDFYTAINNGVSKGWLTNYHGHDHLTQPGTDAHYTGTYHDINANLKSVVGITDLPESSIGDFDADLDLNNHWANWITTIGFALENFTEGHYLWRAPYVFTMTDLQVLCYGGTQTGEPTGGYGWNVLGDGNMEQQPLSSFWFPNTAQGSGDFGRLNNSNLLTVGFGDPRCGSGWQIIGNTNRCAWSLLEFYNDICSEAFGPIHQRFAWPQAGSMYWRFSAKGLPESGWNRNVPINVYVKHSTTQQITVLYQGGVPWDWSDYSGYTGSLEAGNYWLEASLGSGHSAADAFFLDDVVVAAGPITLACDPVIPATTATPQVGGTPTRTITPNGQPGDNLIDNCGFEQGEVFWTWRPQKSFVIYNSANNYAHSNFDAENPGISQPFSWPGGNAYLRFEARSDYNVYFRNVVTGAIINAASGAQPYAGWITHEAAVYLPQGSYRLSLHHPSGSAYSEYDNISLSPGNYSSCIGGSLTTPTAPPDATSTATPTMWPTSTRWPTHTVAAGQPTSTAIPSFTPFPTFTPRPTTAPTVTPRPPQTNTPFPTYTERPTYTPYPSYTPNAQGTTEASPTPSSSPPAPELPAPPAYYADCNRPLSGGEIAGWLEYEKCQTLSFFYMSPNAVSTYAAIPDAFGGREPFGTINEVSQTNQDMKALVDSYDWENTGLPGTGDAINLDQFLTPTGPLVTGHFDFSSNPGPSYSQACETGLADLVGPYLAGGVCFILNVMRSLGIIPWMQLVINLTAIGFLALYIWKKWIDAGSSG